MRKPVRRIIKPGSGPQPPRKSETTITVEQSHARQIRELPKDQLDKVIRSIKEGIPVGRIAAYFQGRGLLQVQEKSFVQYLIAFKRLYPEVIAAFDTESIDDDVDGDAPELSEEDVLQQLVRLQKRRLRLAHNFEKNSEMLNPLMHKEIAVTGNLIEQLAKVRGKFAGAGRPEKEGVSLNPETKNALSSIDRTEIAQNKLVGLFGKLANMVQVKQGNEE